MVAVLLLLLLDKETEGRAALQAHLHLLATTLRTQRPHLLDHHPQHKETVEQAALPATHRPRDTVVVPPRAPPVHHLLLRETIHTQHFPHQTIRHLQQHQPDTAVPQHLDKLAAVHILVLLLHHHISIHKLDYL
jgi:hypothetical protein